MLQWEGGHSGPEDPQQGQVRDESTVLGMSNGSSVRTVTLVKSPSFPPCSCHYHITHMGIRDVCFFTCLVDVYVLICTVGIYACCMGYCTVLDVIHCISALNYYMHMLDTISTQTPIH